MARRFAVIGLGTLGSRLAEVLAGSGAEVLAIDQDLDRLEDIRDRVALAVQLDATEEKALESQRLDECDAVILTMEESFETTLLCFSLLQQMAIRRVIVAARTTMHERILTGLGVKEVVLPDVEAAERLAGSLAFEAASSVFAVSSDYAVAEVPAPDALIGKDLESLSLPKSRNVSLVTIRRSRRQPGILGFGKRVVRDTLGILGPKTVVERGDLLYVFGRRRDIEKLTEA